MSGLLKVLSETVLESAGGVFDKAAANTPQYIEYQKKVQEYAFKNEMMAMAGVATSVTLATLGVCFSLAGRNGIGSGLIITAVPIGYFSYNSNVVYENLKNDISENLIQHMLLLKKGENPEFDQKKVRASLLKRTICYDLFIDFHVESFMAHNENSTEV